MLNWYMILNVAVGFILAKVIIFVVNLALLHAIKGVFKPKYLTEVGVEVVKVGGDKE